MEVFNCSSAVFSGKNRNIIYPILKYSTKYFIFCHVHVFSTDFAGFSEILLIVWSCMIFGRFREIPEGMPSVLASSFYFIFNVK